MKKKRPSIEEIQNMKASDMLNDITLPDIEIDGQNINGGRQDTVDTHWPTSAIQEDPEN